MFTQMLRLGLMAVLVLGAVEAFAAAPKTIDDQFADVATLAPGFGGMYVDPDQDTLYVYLLEDTPAAKLTLEAALTTIFGPEAPKQSRLVVLQGQYSFLELKAWHDRMIAVHGIPGLVLTDIDDTRNRLLVGVATEEAQELVEEQLALLGIPREAVLIEKRAPERFLSSLQDLHRPLVGGLQITHLRNADIACTLGFHAIRAGVPGFVTASHCTFSATVEEGTQIFQPLFPSQVGKEIADPVLFEGGECPLTRKCRYSDSAFARHVIGVDGDLGFIAKADFNSPAWAGETFRIVGEGSIMVGDHVNKVGRTTGRTNGQVTGVCARVDVAGTDITLLCQSKADVSADPGDSGAPVFNIIDTLSPNVRLYGILSTGGTDSTFSPMSNIQDELGSMTKCAPGFGC